MLEITVERELIMTGIGGQGVQVGTRILAQAAAARGLKVMMFGVFHGSVRGGKTESTLVVSENEIEAPPIIAETWSAVALHEKHFGDVEPRLRRGGLCLINTSLFTRPVGRNDLDVIEIPMTAIAEELGNVMLVGMIGLGAYVTASKLVPMDSAVEAMRANIPPYRAKLIPLNEEAMARGADAVATKVS
jgi:2-oxoglutarate ferredoxin oxidoreductase subunit gamma